MRRCRGGIEQGGVLMVRFLTRDPAPIKAKKLRPKKQSKEARAAKKGQEGGKESSENKPGVNGVAEGTPTPHEVTSRGACFAAAISNLA